MLRKLLFVALSTLASLMLHAEEHNHARNEIGLSGGTIYDFDHSRWGGGVHLHYFRRLGEHSRWSLGAGVEQVWDDGRHFTLALGTKFEMLEKLEFGLMPGLTFFSHDDVHDDHEHGADAQFSLHLELVYDMLHWKYFHAGPAVDYSWVPLGGDAHIMLGVHAAVCF